MTVGMREVDIKRWRWREKHSHRAADYDPFRSLAGALKRAGGYAKDKAPFSEFRWADFLRCRISRELVERHFGRALALAMNLAQSTDAASLPGWRRHSN
jgi:hypothetical protein